MTNNSEGFLEQTCQFCEQDCDSCDCHPNGCPTCKGEIDPIDASVCLKCQNYYGDCNCKIQSGEALCNNCGQPLPHIMTCNEWNKARKDLRIQLRQLGGLLRTGY